MRKYQLYLIEDEFASHYFGRERIFFHLFKENRKAAGELKKITDLQISYITKPMPVLRVHQLLHKQLEKTSCFVAKNGCYVVEAANKTSRASLSVRETYILIESEGGYEAETTFFEVLRKSEAYFLAIDLDNNKVGWLRPIKERKFV
ncbi:sporulation inhibitor of replication protein SirA [Neobacillus notoginsengisoli]|uniref:Sporulation inhibitor of replication protein SirA n=1 Tax=Neobacillus notoginsengisoli TaxID=1578198 RepID=A0A417YRM7_9BACI|nr:sporulation inhibitor of replication protein SirA [Neobacillus notoginsengisoli]RHW37965.1 sporulation inhibitor of replication protein SirA [Neobacillus notoginsengisoli]